LYELPDLYQKDKLYVWYGWDVPESDEAPLHTHPVDTNEG